jgi:YYY domain-containing protein
MTLEPPPAKRPRFLGPRLSQETVVTLTLLLILIVGGAFRFYNVNWDEGTYHIHPDERNTTMVITAIDWPASLGEYFDTSRSPLNPSNRERTYFYGTLPLFLTKAVATALDQADYDQIHLVGRVLSGIFDLLTVLLTYMLGRRLLSKWAGLLAAFLLATAVLNIQGSHYFAVDTFLTFFVTLVLWFTLDLAEAPTWRTYINLGLAMGGTMACKASIFLLAAVVGLAAWLRLRRAIASRAPPSRVLGSLALGLSLSVVLSLAVFRVAQPYAWAGPSFTQYEGIPEEWIGRFRIFERLPDSVQAVLMPNPQWWGGLASAGAQQTGTADLPWGRQWTERTPWLWPLYNMVVWGMGVPLGAVAWMGVALFGIYLVLQWRQDWRTGVPFRPPSSGMAALSHRPQWYLLLLPWVWAVLTFAWQGMQFVKSVRYFLPIFPALVLLAAWLAHIAWRWAAQPAGGPTAQPQSSGDGPGWVGRIRANLCTARSCPRLALAGLLTLVLAGGALAWAFAFIQIYTEPVTRVQATAWIYENAPSGATIYYTTASGRPETFQARVPSSYRYGEPGHFLLTPFELPEPGTITHVTMNDLTSIQGGARSLFEVAIVEASGSAESLASAQQGLDLLPHDPPPRTGTQFVFDLPDVWLEADRSYFLRTGPYTGAPVLSQGATLANEHFDDPLPFNMFARAAFGRGGVYQGMELALYNEDTPDKLDTLLEQLDQTDYVILSSGRLWQSIPRLPMRYPVTTRYYELLFAEELGFEKAAEFHAYPRLFGIEFDDTWAEEQFTVYDHPKVLIYRKTADWDVEQARVMLSDGIDWESIPHWLNPIDVPEWRRTHEAATDLLLDDEQEAIQQAGGTWSELFDPNNLVNRVPVLAWLVLIEVLSLATLPLALAVFWRLPDRGYTFAKPVGVLLLAYLTWMVVNLTPLHYTRGTIALALLGLAVGAWATLAIPRQRMRLVSFWRGQRRTVLVAEVVFLAVFVVWLLIRMGNPDLWHPYKGGEKPMDFAYLNAVIKSTVFPPYDPWFAGGYLNYYYFGQILVGTLVKLVGIVPYVAYNLALPFWAAMLGVGSFGVVSNLVKSRHPQVRGARVWLSGLVGTVFVLFLGNLAELHLLLLKAAEASMTTFESTIPGLAGLVRTAIGLVEVTFGEKALPIGIGEWYWNATRVIPHPPGEAVPINEFPFFTFLYADLHAHLIALPLAMLALGLALTVALRGSNRAEQGWLCRLPPLLMLSLTLGALRCTNTWDYPPYFLLLLAGLAIAEWKRERRVTARLLWNLAWQAGLVFGLSWFVLYRPFWANYGTYYNAVEVWPGSRTPVWAYLVMHGLFLFVIASALVAWISRDPWVRRLRLWNRYRHAPERLQRHAKALGIRGLPPGLPFWATVGALLAVALLLLAWPGSASRSPGGEGFYRGLRIFGLMLPVALLGARLFFRPPSRRGAATMRFWSALVLLGVGMTLGVELLVLEGDISRMNTVFKFYLQAWLVWAVASAAALGWLAQAQRPAWLLGSRGWRVVLAVLVLTCALYPVLATWAKVNDRFDHTLGPGLDGLRYMTTAQYWDRDEELNLGGDYLAIKWMLNHVEGSPVILEGHTSEYRWGARYSINTGLPTVLGWNWHQRQQRAAASEGQVWQRANDVTTAYDTPSLDLARQLLRQYDVRYVIVGGLERAYYARDGLAKFETLVELGELEVAYDAEGVTVYEVTDLH